MPDYPLIDPFAGDPDDPAAELGADDSATGDDRHDREDVLADLADLEVFQALLEPAGIRGIATRCADCQRTHYVDWELLSGTLRDLLEHGRAGVHEPAYDPDPGEYVSWDYARGYVDGVIDSELDSHDLEA